MKFASTLLVAGTLLSGAAMAHNHGHEGHDKMMAQRASAPNAKAYIVSPKDGAVVGQTFTVHFGLKGMGVAPAGVQKAKTGHHHLLIDTDKLPNLHQPLGGDVKHFGGGQTEVELTLAPGKHTLQLILGDERHIPHKPAVVSEKITITVK